MASNNTLNWLAPSFAMCYSRRFGGRVGNWPRNMALSGAQHWGVECLAAVRVGNRDGPTREYSDMEPRR